MKKVNEYIINDVIETYFENEVEDVINSSNMVDCSTHIEKAVTIASISAGALALSADEFCNITAMLWKFYYNKWGV